MAKKTEWLSIFLMEFFALGSPNYVLKNTKNVHLSTLKILKIGWLSDEEKISFSVL